MIEITPKLYIGTTDEIAAVLDFKIVNLAHTFHYDLHHWKLRDKSVDRSSDPCYILHTDPRILSLNWIDGEAKYFDYNGEGVRNVQKALSFIDKFLGPFNVLITCNKGQSRSPSLGMVYLAKCTNELSERVTSDDGFVYSKPTYQEARERFMKLYPFYLPGQGITQFLIEHWHEL